MHLAFRGPAIATFRGWNRPGGDGGVRWSRVIAFCREAKRDIVRSVECGTIEQAARSIDHLQPVLACC